MEYTTQPFIVVGKESFNITRLVDEEDVFHIDIKIEDALLMASAQGLDLVCFGDSDSDSPLCKMIDYGKWRYDQEKKKKKLNKVQKNHAMKEVRFTPLIQAHDVEHKVKQIKHFIENGHEVLMSMRIKSRLNRTDAQNTMNSIVDQCKDFSSVLSEKKTNNSLMVRISKKK